MTPYHQHTTEKYITEPLEATRTHPTLATTILITGYCILIAIANTADPYTALGVLTAGLIITILLYYLNNI